MRRNNTPEQQQAALLNRPGILLPKPTFLSSFLFYTVLLFVAWVSAFGCFYSAFQMELDWLPLLLAGAVFSMLCSAQFLPERRKWLFPLVTAVLCGLFLWWNFEEAARGFRLTVNAVSEAYSQKLHLTPPLPTFSTPPATPLMQRTSCTVFAVFLAFFFFWVLSWLLVRHKSALGAFCLTGLFLLFPLAFSIEPEEWAFGLLLIFWAFLLLAAPSMRQRRQLVETGTAFHSSGDMFFRPASLALLPLLALCLIFLYRLFLPETYVRPEFASNLRSGLTEGLGISPSSLHSGTGNTERIDFSSLGSRHYTGKTALQVQYEWQSGIPEGRISPTGQKDYLKSFAGSVYTSTGWEHLSSEDAERVNEIWSEETQKPQHLSSALLLAMPMESDPNFSYLLSVRNLEGTAKAAYAPYGLFAPEGVPENTEYQDDGFLQFTSPGTRVTEYSFSAVALPGWDAATDTIGYAPRFTHHYETVLFRRFDSVTASQLQDKLTNDFETQSQEGLPYPNWDRWESPEWAKKLLNTYSSPASDPLINSNFPFTGAELVEPLESYTEFVYQVYTQLPDDVRDFSERFLAENHLPSVAAVGRQGYLQQIRDLLAEQCSYTLTPPSLPWGQDFVKYFLTESHSGYCVHFATAATVLLRAAGIPARYAEGYTVPSGADGRWINVPDYNAHAWVEVYWGGIGWLPVEVTPPGPMVPAAYANATGPDNSETPAPTPTPAPDSVSSAVSEPESSNAPEASPSPAPSAPVESQESEGAPVGAGSTPPPGITLSSSGWLTFWGLLFIGLCLASPFLLLWTLRLIRLFRRKKSFHQKDHNKAALCVYAHLLRLYRENTALPGDGIEPSEELTELALKARFSDHTLTRGELSLLIKQAELLEKKLEADLPKWERLRCKYLLALF